MIRTLQSYDEILAARAQLGRRGLDFTTVRRLRLWDAIYRVRFRATRPPTDVSKSWDVLRAVEIIESAMPDHGAPVLDMGCYNSEVLWVLDALGYRGLFGCDLNPLCRLMPFWHRIRYRGGTACSSRPTIQQPGSLPSNAFLTTKRWLRACAWAAWKPPGPMIGRILRPTRDVQRRAEVTFPADAQGNVVLTVNDLACNLNLVTHAVTGCH